jgi:BioD-like phosphotransacetylase family protein
MDPAELNHRFNYHRPNAETAEKHQRIRSSVLFLANGLNDALPEGREKSLVITHLEEAMFWANAALARSNPLD